MGRIVVMNHVTLDGVMQGPGRPDEDSRDGFAHSGWAQRSAAPGDATARRWARGLALVEALALGDYHLWHAIRADLLARAGRRREADAAYRNAIERTDNAAERRHLERRRAALRVR